MNLIIKNIRIIDPDSNYSGRYDVVVDSGRIKDISKDLVGEFDETLDGSSYALAPGFIDLHCHLRDPGFTHKEDLESGGKAALAGGFTTVCAIANTKPAIDTVETARDIIERGKRLGGPTIIPFGAISYRLQGENATDFKALMDAGCVGLSDDGIHLRSREILEQAFRFSAETGATIALHEEDLKFGAGTRESEIESIKQDIDLFAKIGGKLHIQHVSLRESCELIEAAQQKGLPVTGEVTPHHLCLTEEDFKEIGNDAKCSPPLRTQEDVDYLVDALSRGVISAVATDHAPHTKEEKNRLNQGAPNGILGLQTALPVLLNLVDQKKLTLERAIESLTVSPAKVMGLKNVGRIKIGGDANLVVLDLDKTKTFSESDIFSKSFNSPFIGKKFKGCIRATIHEGHFKYISE